MDAVGEWTFDTHEERDAFLAAAYPERKASDVPGLYTLPDGQRVGVLGRIVTHYAPAQEPAQEYDNEPAAMRFVQEPYRTRIIEDAEKYGGVADIAVGFDELLVTFGNGTTERYS